MSGDMAIARAYPKFTEYDFNSDVLFKKFIKQNLDSDQMLDYIRHECLNLIIARKKLVKERMNQLKDMCDLKQEDQIIVENEN